MPAQLLKQKTVFEEYLRRAPNSLSAASFANIFAWRDFFEFDFKILDGCLCVFAKNPVGTFLYLPPLGKDVSSNVIDACFRIMQEANQGSGVTRIENVAFGQLALFPTDKFAHYKKGYEYCYYRDDIASLQGNPYKSKRSSYNQFISNYQHVYVSYDEKMIDGCLGLYEHWAEARRMKQDSDIYCHMLDENRKVHETVLQHYRALGLTGRVVLIDGHIKAYTFGFALSREMFCVLFEISDLEIKGLATYIFRELCCDKIVRPYKFINVMDDFGMDNIRQTKMSFKPCALLPLYVITKKSLSDEPISF